MSGLAGISFILAAFSIVISNGSAVVNAVWLVDSSQSISAADSIGSSKSLLDPSARSASFGAFEEAYRYLDPSTDSLRAGILASLCGMHEDALNLLRREQKNLYLEKYRLFYRARSLLAKERFVEALESLEVASNCGSRSLKRSARLDQRIRELEVEILSSSDSLIANRQLPSKLSKLSPRSHYLLAASLMRAGLDSLGCAELRRSLDGSWSKAERTLLSNAISLCDECYEEMREEELNKIARNAVSVGLCEDAMHIIKIIVNRRGSESAEIKLLRASVLSCEGKRQEAIEIYEKLIQADSPGTAEKEAFRRLASLRYSLGQYEKAIELCRSYYKRFPDDPERYAMLALGGRIEIERGNLSGAYDAFVNLVDKKVYEETNGAGIDYVSAASALACVLSKNDDINARLWALVNSLSRSSALAKANNMAPAVLYWLWRTEPLAGKRDSILSVMKSAYPYSHFTVAAMGMLDSLKVCDRYISSEKKLSRLAVRELSSLDSLALDSGFESSIAGSQAFDAYRYFIDCGLVLFQQPEP